MKTSSTHLAKISISVLSVFVILTMAALRYALHIPTDYNMEQFLPKSHELLQWDRESKKVFQISDVSPHILLLSFDASKKEFWLDSSNLQRLEKLGNDITALKTVRGVVSLANVKSAYENKSDLTVGNLRELTEAGKNPKSVLKDPKFAPNLVSKDGRFTAVFINPGHISQEQHRALAAKVQKMAKDAFPTAGVRLGGPAAIRTQLIDLLSKEIVIFILLSLIAAITVIKLLFRGWAVIFEVSGIVVITNILAGGLMGKMGISFNILTSTVPILVTICTLGNVCHTLARMSPFAHLRGVKRTQKLRELMRELIGPHLMAAGTTAIGFATLVHSQVPMIATYGLIVSLCAMLTSISALLLVPALFYWLPWPAQRDWMVEQKLFAFYLVKYRTAIHFAMIVLIAGSTIVGSRLSWTARLFDDLPANHPARASTELISKKLGGVAPLDLIIGGDSLNSPWKNPINLKKLNTLTEKWRHQISGASLVSLVDLMRVGSAGKAIPKTTAAAAEIQFLYGMSDGNPVRYFLSTDEKWTRVALRLPDLPADKSQQLIASLTKDIESSFPHMKVKTAGLAAIVPPMNDELSRELMWGFFAALFWIVLMLAVSFRSLRWALVGVIPNLAPPAILIGVLALADISIKPGIAIIFSISIGIAFDNTIYVLGRLREFMKNSPVERRQTLPIYQVMKVETTPCIISSLALFAGFSIFIFSYFPVNKIFGVFMLIAITAGLLGDLVWLPALLRKYPQLLLGKMKSENLEETSNLREFTLTASSWTIAFLVSALLAQPAHGATSVQEILKQVEAKQSPPDERVVLKLVIVEPDGTKKERLLSILRKNDKEARALVRLLQPADLKGLSVLTVSSQGQEDQWLYLPSAKKSRRIVGSNKKGRFLDSEIAYEDLRISTYKQFDNKVTRETPTAVEIESVAKGENDSSYGKIHTWISKPEYQVQKVDYYDKNGKLLKQMAFSSYQKVGDKFWRARKVSVQNVQDKRKTDLILQKLSLKKISKDEVSLESLEE